MCHLFLFFVIALFATATVHAQCDPCNNCGTFVPDYVLFSGGVTCQLFQDNDYGQFGDLTQQNPNDPICLSAQTSYCSFGCCSDSPVPPTGNDDGGDDGGGNGGGDLICEEASTGFSACLSANFDCIQACSEATQFTGDCDPTSDEACRAQICEQYACCPACENNYKEYINCVASQEGFMNACPIAGPHVAPSTPSVIPPSTTMPPVPSMTDDDGGGGSPECVGKMDAAFSCLAATTSCDESCSNRVEWSGDCDPITDEACRLQICEEYSCCPPCENKFKDYINCEASQIGFDMACTIVSTPTVPTTPSAVSPSTTMPPIVSMTDDDGGMASPACVEKIAVALSCYEMNPGCEELCMDIAEPTGDCNPVTDEACRSQFCGSYACCAPCENKFKEFINCEASQYGLVNACPIVSPTLAPTKNPTPAPTMVRIVPVGNDSSTAVIVRGATMLLVGVLCFFSFVLV